MIKLLIGGSPCTYWSIAQKHGRETKASGMGWELFKNYIIAKDKFNPDFFLYENNQSAAQPIKDMIKLEFGVTDGLQLDMFTPETGVRYIEINSALVSAQNRERFYVHNCGNVQQPKDRGLLLKDILESGTPWKDKAYTIDSNYYKGGGASLDMRFQMCRRMMVAESIQVGAMPRPNGEMSKSAGFRIYSSEAKGRYLCANGGGAGAKTGLYALPVAGQTAYAIPCEWSKNGEPTKAKSTANGKVLTVYKVVNGNLIIKDKHYPITLADGYYIIRMLTVTECCRLQTLPDDYCKAVSDTQAYKGLGNGWTAEVIIHILNNALATVPKDEEIVVLSMYDGIGTGRYCLDKMGFTNVKYYAYEIDKYAMQIAKSNYPDIIEMGDAFAVRNDDWKLE